MAKYKNSTQTKTKTRHAPSFADSREYPVFSFQHLTSNKTYSFAYFKNAADAKDAAHSLLEKLIELSSSKISELLGMRKARGFETIPQSRFNHKMSIAETPLPSDAKLYVLRFDNQNFRLICFKAEDISNLFYIMAFDFDYSIYSHG
jgi:hypothetical protein